MLRRTFLAGLATAGSLAASRAALGQDYPNRPVRLVVPFAPGGTTDIIARVVAGHVTPHLGQPLVIENKGGGGGAIGATETARAVPDGYSLGVATVSTVATNPAVQPRTPYNPVTDFTPIINIASTPNVIAVNPSFPARTYTDFLAEVRRNPGRHSYASPGQGSITHLMMELFMGLTDTRMTHIPYKGSGPALNDVVAGQVPIMFDNLPSSLPFIRAGRLVPIVLAAPERLREMPDVPTFKEVGLEPVNRVAFYGLYGPRNLPQDVVERVNGAVRRTLEEPAVRARIEETGSAVIAGSPEEFGRQIRDEYEVYARVVEERKIRPE